MHSLAERSPAPPPVLLLWTIYALFAAGLQLQDGVIQPLFLSRVGADELPLMFIVKAALDMLTALIYVRLARALGHQRTLLLLLLIACAAPLALWALLGLAAGQRYVAAAAFAYNEGLQTALKIHWGVYLLDHLPGEAAPRSLPTVYTGARIGAVCGGLLLGLGAGSGLGLDSLLPWCAPAFILAACLVHAARRRAVEADETFGPVSDAAQGLSSGRRSPLVRAIAAATAAMVLCRIALRYRYSELLAARFSETELARYYGLYAVAANLGAAALQLLLTRWLLVTAGIGVANMLYAAAMPAAAALLWLRPGIGAAVVARLVDHEVKLAIKTPLSNLFYNALPPVDRPAARGLILGLLVPTATIAAALLLRSPLPVAPWLTVLAVAFVGLSVWQNRAYAAARR